MSFTMDAILIHGECRFQRRPNRTGVIARDFAHEQRLADEILHPRCHFGMAGIGAFPCSEFGVRTFAFRFVVRSEAHYPGSRLLGNGL